MDMRRPLATINNATPVDVTFANVGSIYCNKFYEQKINFLLFGLVNYYQQ